MTNLLFYEPIVELLFDMGTNRFQLQLKVYGFAVLVIPSNKSISIINFKQYNSRETIFT